MHVRFGMLVGAKCVSGKVWVVSRVEVVRPSLCVWPVNDPNGSLQLGTPQQLEHFSFARLLWVPQVQSKGFRA